MHSYLSLNDFLLLLLLCLLDGVGRPLGLLLGNLLGLDTKVN